MTTMMLACLAYELRLRNHPPLATDAAVGDWDPQRFCEHTPNDAYTRAPCSCGRPLWPPKGRGRGESMLSRRRVAARLKTVEAEKLRVQGYSYQAIADMLGYATASGVWRALQRLRDYRAAWRLYEDRTGHRRYQRSVDAAQAYVARQEADQEIEVEIEALQERLAHASREEQLAIADEYLRRMWVPGEDDDDGDGEDGEDEA